MKNLNHILSTVDFTENQGYTRSSVDDHAGSAAGLGAEFPISTNLVNSNTIFTTNKADISIIQIISDMIVNMQIIIR